MYQKALHLYIVKRSKKANRKITSPDPAEKPKESRSNRKTKNLRETSPILEKTKRIQIQSKNQEPKRNQSNPRENQKNPDPIEKPKT
jgi:hypothetical protein